jgi:hypothetical protein
MRLIRTILVAAALSLAACTPAILDSGQSPSSVADSTVIDEKAMLGLETLYLSANQLAQTALDLGIVKGDESRAEVKEADRKAYNALLAARAAYRAGNSRSFSEATADLAGLTDQIRLLTRKP